jgi:hypothetical protein
MDEKKSNNNSTKTLPYIGSSKSGIEYLLDQKSRNVMAEWFLNLKSGKVSLPKTFRETYQLLREMLRNELGVLGKLLDSSKILTLIFNFWLVWVAFIFRIRYKRWKKDTN